MLKMLKYFNFSTINLKTYLKAFLLALCIILMNAAFNQVLENVKK
jgi:hypothetical protein